MTKTPREPPQNIFPPRSASYPPAALRYQLAMEK